jgi:hypothetical protein
MPYSKTPPFPVCPLCNEAAEINTAKTDDEGRAVHEECYVRNLAQSKGAPKVA